MDNINSFLYKMHQGEAGKVVAQIIPVIGAPPTAEGIRNWTERRRRLLEK